MTFEKQCDTFHTSCVNFIPKFLSTHQKNQLHVWNFVVCVLIECRFVFLRSALHRWILELYFFSKIYKVSLVLFAQWNTTVCVAFYVDLPYLMSSPQRRPKCALTMSCVCHHTFMRRTQNRYFISWQWWKLQQWSRSVKCGFPYEENVPWSEMVFFFWVASLTSANRNEEKQGPFTWQTACQFANHYTLAGGMSI